MVTEIAKARGIFSSGAIKRIRKVRNKWKRINWGIMIPLFVVGMDGDINECLANQRVCNKCKQPYFTRECIIIVVPILIDQIIGRGHARLFVAI